jgi:hypothetical protein
MVERRYAVYSAINDFIYDHDYDDDLHIIATKTISLDDVSKFRKIIAGTEFLFDRQTRRYLSRTLTTLSMAAMINEPNEPGEVYTYEDEKKQVADFFCVFTSMLDQHFEPHLNLSKIGLGKITSPKPPIDMEPPSPPTLKN